MSSSLRSIVKKRQQEQALRKYLGDKFETTPDEIKEKLLSAADESIEREVNSILNAFIEEALKDSPETKRRKSKAILNLLSVIISTPSIAYGVNIENWTMVIVISLLLALVQIYIIWSEF